MDMVDTVTAVVIGGMFVFWVATTGLLALIVYMYDWRSAGAAEQHAREAAAEQHAREAAAAPQVRQPWSQQQLGSA